MLTRAIEINISIDAFKRLALILLSIYIACHAISAQDTISHPAINKVLSKVETVIDRSNFLDNLAPDSNVALPFGIRKQIGAARYVIAIDSCKFEPTGAYFNAYAAIDFPGSTKKLAFEATNIKFNPKGVVGGSQSRLLLVSEHTLRINDLVSLNLKADGSNWIEWDCGGYKAINLTGHFIFNKGKIVPDSLQSKTDTVVTASFHIYTTDLHEFVTQVSITPFCIKGLKNWSFSVKDATVDMSELVNYPGMTFPAGYTNPNMISPQMWTGFALKSVKVKLPSEISKEGKRTEVTASNLLIDNMGITGLFQINNVLKLDEGSMSGWDYSIDELGIGFLCNKLNSGHLKGRVNIPVMDSAQSLAYTADVSYKPENQEANYNFTMSPVNNIKFNVFSAQVNLNNTSQITVIKQNNLFKPTAILNGYISFNHSNFNSNGGQLLFQDLTIETHAPYLTKGIFTLHNIGNQTRVANYPVSVSDITFGINLTAPIMTFSVSLNLTDNATTGFSIGTTATLKGKIQSSTVSYKDEVPITYTKTKWGFDKVVINGFSLGVKTSVVALQGTLLFLDNDPIYGNGFFGHILFSIKNVLPSPATVSARFGAKSDFRYYYVDAAIPTEIPLGGTPITLTKIMGGIYYHMQPLKASKQDLITASKTQPAKPATALTYSPDKTWALGFKAGVGFKYTPQAKAANGDVMLEVGFTKGGGLSYVNLSGDIYFMAKPNQQQKSPATGSVDIAYDAQNKIFDASANVTINVQNGSVNGIGQAKFHIEPNSWYACIGKPSVPNTIQIAQLAGIKAYFMTGSSIDPAPAPPPEVLSKLGSSALGIRDENTLQSGAGFCAGASLSAADHNTFGFKGLNVYGNVNFTAGFDMMMLDYGEDSYCEGDFYRKIGLNGKLATGSMYVYFSANVGAHGKIGPKNFNVSVFNTSAAGRLSGKLPEPLYVKGEFACDYDIWGLGVMKGTFYFDFDYGQNCTPLKN